MDDESGHPSAAGRAQDRESSPARDRRSTTVPRHQHHVASMNANIASCINLYRNAGPERRPCDSA